MSLITNRLTQNGYLSIHKLQNHFEKVISEKNNMNYLQND